MADRSFRARSATLAAMVLSACATTPAIRVDHASLGQPIAKAEVVIEPSAPTPADSPQFLAAANAVGQELLRSGFRLAATQSTTSDLIAVVDYTRVDRPLSWLSRTFVSTPIAAGDQPADRHRGYLETVTLKLDLRRRSDQSMMWQGNASIDTRVASPGKAGETPFAAELAAAVFKSLATSGP